MRPCCCLLVAVAAAEPTWKGGSVRELEMKEESNN